MKKIKIWFSDFYDGFAPEDNPLQQMLSKYYDLEFDPHDPDYLIYSCHGQEFINFNCIKIFYTGENLRPDFNLCDYAIGFDFLNFGDRYLRYPNFAFIEDQVSQLIRKKQINKENISSKEYFCNFIYSNSTADPARDNFFQLLNSYQKVYSPGSHLNNFHWDIGRRFSKDWMYTKLEFQSKCKFSIAFENSSSPGYTTEKIVHAFICNTVPIYWGNPEICRDFNPKSFINCHNYQNFEQVLERIKEVDNSKEEYFSILKEPPFLDNKLPDSLNRQNLIDFFQNILDQEKSIAFRRPKFGTTIKYENDLKSQIRLKKNVGKLKKTFLFLGNKWDI